MRDFNRFDVHNSHNYKALPLMDKLALDEIDAEIKRKLSMPRGEHFNSELARLNSQWIEIYNRKFLTYRPKSETND